MNSIVDSQLPELELCPNETDLENTAQDLPMEIFDDSAESPGIVVARSVPQPTTREIEEHLA